MDGLAAAALEAFGRVDVWANVAEIITYFPLLDAVESDVRKIIDVNLLDV